MKKLVPAVLICAAFVGAVGASSTESAAPPSTSEAVTSSAQDPARPTDQVPYGDVRVWLTNRTNDTQRVNMYYDGDDHWQDLRPGESTRVDPGKSRVHTYIPGLWPKAPKDRFWMDVDCGLVFNSVKIGYDRWSGTKHFNKKLYDESNWADRDCWQDTFRDGCRTFHVVADKSDSGGFDCKLTILESTSSQAKQGDTH